MENTKPKAKGLLLQMDAVFTRLNALKQVLSPKQLEEYNQFIEKEKQSIREQFDVDEQQLDEWYR